LEIPNFLLEVPNFPLESPNFPFGNPNFNFGVLLHFNMLADDSKPIRAFFKFLAHPPPDAPIFSTDTSFQGEA
jgi:hypothetical protein